MTRLNIIKNKLEKLKNFDKNYCVFGSINHKYKLNNTLSKSELKQFEKINNITLPKEYANFLLEIGNGGAGPDYGLIGITPKQLAKRYCRFSYTFRFSGDFVPNTYDHCTMIEDDDLSCEDCHKRFSCVDAFYEDDFECTDDYISGYLDGTLNINHMGCGLESRLILNGPEFGNVWINDPDQLFTPRRTLTKDRLSFYDWYENWLDSQLSKFELIKSLFDKKVPYEEFFNNSISSFEVEEIIATFLGLSLIKTNLSNYESSKFSLRELNLDLEKEYIRYIKQ
ncbi:Uncharacterised protein [[Clostridium] sordellii]|uniref:SMI1/KNR4 family protein n=1 Tax=Paraclostridium sordellii TaxID=1505 RepID=UPI0005DA98EC|nr:SMI1/KNR4 family protein [Paeniclostridium sordellii]CEP95517.1 Uncharacterised protein [[Clostridium] sordellii] [Paeniclostridium sordellii]